MIIAFNGDEGSGKSTIAKLVAKELGYPHYSMGDLYRQLARTRGMTLEELHELCKVDPSIDQEVDAQLVELGKKESNFVIDSRLAWHFLPQSIKIYLSVDEKEAARRIFTELQQNDERNEARDLDSVEKVWESIRDRRVRDDDRYKRYYDLSIRQPENYDFVFDTTELSIDQVHMNVLKFIQQARILR